MKLHLLIFFVIHVFICTGQSRTKNLDQYIDSLLLPKEKSVPGVAVTVIQEGKVLVRKQYGLANIEHGIPFLHSSPVRMSYSGAREFMCAGLAVMEKEGVLRFTDKVRTYFPKLPLWSDAVTIQDLLNHTSGFADEWATLLLMQADMNNRLDNEQLLTFLYNQPAPEFEPRKGYMYSNSDFALLRFIMEKASGKKLPDYLKEKLFTPLGMNSTFMNDHLEQIIPGLADKYYDYGIVVKNVGVKTSPGGNYRIVTTADDLEKWALALDNPNSIASHSLEQLNRIARPIPVLAPEVHYTYGHEWQKQGGADVVKHGGVNHDFYMTRIPSLKLTIIGLANAPVLMTRAEAVAHYFLPKDTTRVRHILPDTSGTTKPDPKVLNQYTGRYINRRKITHSSHINKIEFYDLSHSGDKLDFYFTPTEYFTMVPLGNGLFKDPDYGTLFQFTSSHPDSMKMNVFVSDYEVRVFDRKPLPDVPEKSLQQFTGQYHSKHLDFYLRIVLSEDGKLVMTRPTIADKNLLPYGKDRFIFPMEGSVGDVWYVECVFTRDKKGTITGIDMQHNRMMKHRFDKVRQAVH